GSLTNNGTFTHGSGTVILNTASTATIGGSSATTFHNLTSTTAGKTIQFKAGQDVAIDGTFTITGTNSSHIHLYSDSPGSRWNIIFTGSPNLRLASIRDAGCGIGTNTISVVENVSDAGNNDYTCWLFAGRGGGNGASLGNSGSSGGSGGGNTGGGSGGSLGDTGSSGGSGGGTTGGGDGASP